MGENACIPHRTSSRVHDMYLLASMHVSSVRFTFASSRLRNVRII